MKKFILLISVFILSSNFSYADTGNSSVSRSSNSLGTECGEEIRHGVTHHGVPNSNSSTAGASGSSSCATHSYYASSQYYIENYSGFQGCNTGDRAINTGNDAPETGNLTCWEYDDTDPTLGNLNITNDNSEHLLAQHDYVYEFTIKVGDDEAPITTASGTLNGNPINISCDTPDVSSRIKTTTCTMTWDIRDVDSNRGGNGGREYVFSLDTICDEAKNCSTDGPKIFTHYVYANTINFPIHQVLVNNLGDNSNIADGTTKTFSILLKDEYGNAIVPASGINRNIDFNFNSITNTMFLNQINRDGGNSVFVKRPDSDMYDNNLLNTWNQSINITATSPVGASYGSGQYDFEFKVYTPTASQNNGPISDINAKFSVSSIDVDINSSRNIKTGANPTKVALGANNSINAKFSPLYYTEITGDGGNIKDNGIIEGGFQESKIKVQKNGSTSSSNNQLLLSYGSSKEGKNDAEKFIMHAGSTEENSNSTTINSVPTTINTNPGFPNLGGISTNLYTRLIQVQTVNTGSNIYLATHIKYEITNPNGPSSGDLNVKYNSDIVGKASYWGEPDEDAIGNQAGIKIIGLTATHSSTNLVEGQFINDIYTLDSNYTKSTLKTQLIKNGYEFARNLVGNDNIPLTSIDDPSFNNIKMINNVIYFGKTAGNIAPTIYKLGNNSNENIKISEKRTILVIGGDLYINSNLYYSGNGMLGIMVLKDANGNGGNVYINPGVTNIVGSIFAEKSIISYNGTELDGLTPASTLKNQLHIYGSIFSENTIGGSRETTPKCPFYVNIPDCTLEVAQKYDLNYLRRYYLIKDGAYFKPANDGKLIGGGRYSTLRNGNVTIPSTSPNYARKIEKTSDEYAKYPVIVEYNPRTQTTIPPLFLINK